jgi:hypothetical protein
MWCIKISLGTFEGRTLGVFDFQTLGIFNGQNINSTKYCRILGLLDWTVSLFTVLIPVRVFSAFHVCLASKRNHRP